MDLPTTFLGWAYMIGVGGLGFVFVITLVVFVHELGHFLAARYFGVRVESFSIGFGRAIVGFTDRHGTHWKVGWLPLGGYVKFWGDDGVSSAPDHEKVDRATAAERAGSFHHKPLYQKSIVALGGPVANFILAVVILTCLLMIYGRPVTLPQIGLVKDGTPAAEAGFKVGDLVLSINGEPINEFGEIGIDNDLIVDADEEVFEMNNGCVCCTVRGDLIRIIEGLMKRQSAKNGGSFDAILVETTGLAKPAPVAQTFFVDADVRASTKLDAIVTVVDAKHLPQQLASSEEAVEQIAFADVILLSKTDLVSPGELASVERQIRSINTTARLHRMVRGDIALEQILNVGAFDLERISEIDPHFLPDHACGDDCAHHEHGHHDDHGHQHEHDHVAAAGITSVSLSTEKLIDPEKLLPWLNQITQERGPDILRLKGIIAFPDEPKRFVVQGVHMLLEGDTQRDWRDGEQRISRLVFIGRNLDRTELETAFEACAA